MKVNMRNIFEHSLIQLFFKKTKHLRALTHQADVKDLAVMKASSVVAYSSCVLAKMLHFNTPHKWQLAAINENMRTLGSL